MLNQAVQEACGGGVVEFRGFRGRVEHQVDTYIAVFGELTKNFQAFTVGLILVNHLRKKGRKQKRDPGR